MKINVRHIAKLANLTLKKEEVKKLESQLSQVLGHIEKLNEVDTANVQPTSQVTGLTNVFREDNITPSLTQKQTLAQSKSTQNGLFMIKGILDTD